MSYIFTLAFCLVLISCQLQTQRDSSPEKGASSNLVDPKYSLAKDRSQFDQLRKSIPPDIQKTNDEKALTAELFAEVKYPPEKVREKFENVLRKKRESFNKDRTQEREKFNKNERKNREDFLKKLDDERKDFLSEKVDREKRADFFNEQDEKRKNYFSEQKDQREEFESEIREKRKNFEDYLKEKNDEFNFEMKSYQQRWKEKTQPE